MTPGSILVAVALVAIALAAAFGAGAWLGSFLAGKYRYTVGHREGYDAGYSAMLKVHEDYRAHNRGLLKMLQSLTPDDPGTIDAGAQPPGTFDTSGNFDVHVASQRGARAVGRAPTLEQARDVAKRILERSEYLELVITKPGPDGPRVDVERVRLSPGGLSILPPAAAVR